MFLRPEVPPKFAPWLKPCRYKIARGGRGGGKSETIARLLITEALKRKCRILCAREIQKSIKESVMYTLSTAIESLGVSAFFDVGQSYIRCVNGSEFLFCGLKHNMKSIKSMGGIDIVWIEESEQLSAETWILLDPTIRQANSEIWFSYNPEDEKSIMHQMAENPYDNMLVITLNYDDNPWFPDVLEAQRVRMASDPELQEDYEHVWLGKPKKNLHAQIFRGKWAVEYFEVGEDWNGPYFGNDWGFAADPTTLTKAYISEEVLYIQKAMFKYNLDIDLTPKAFELAMPEAAGHIITADSASPANISYMKRNGYPRMRGAKKGPNSVKDGIARLRGFEKIVIAPDLTDMIDEARLYSWKVDKLTGQVLDIPVDKHNHGWDAIRYSIEELLLSKRRKKARSRRGSFMER